MKILNLYAGLGGNRKLWSDEFEITAIEHINKIATPYKKMHPGDTVITCDSIWYLQHNFENFDFIWASPPCTTHSRLNGIGHKPKFPDLTLYSIILFLDRYYGGKYCVENVIPWYPPLIKPTVKLGRHYFWSNFDIPNKSFNSQDNCDLSLLESKKLAINRRVNMKDISNIKGKLKRTVLRNMVDQRIGHYILQCAMGLYEKNLEVWMK